MVKIFRYFKAAEWICVILSIAFVVAQVWLELKIPDYMAEVTTLIQAEDSEMSSIIEAGAKMLGCAFGGLLTSVIVAILASRIGAVYSATLREKLYSKVQSFSMEEISNFSTASLITRSTNDVTQVQMLIVMGLQAMIKAPIMAIMAIQKIADKNWEWTMTTVGAIGVLLVVIIICLILATPKFRALQRMTDDLNRVTRENLNGINVVRAYNAEGYQEQKFDVANTELTKTNLFANKTMAFMMPTIFLVLDLLAMAIYWVGAYLVDKADGMDKVTTISDMMVFSQYAMQIVMAFMLLVMIFILTPRASVAAKRILEVLNTVPTINDPEKSSATAGNTASKDAGSNVNNGMYGEVEFRDVTFSYPDAEDNVIEHISFSAHKGETVAFIGSTGCGKSSVINLVPRFYDVTRGEVLVDGKNVKDYTQYDLHNKIGYVSQRAVLFAGSVASNISFGDNGQEKNEARVEEAAKVAQATEFIENIENKYEGFVSQGGTNLSGGQKQRLSIARAICRRPEIFIFDDSFSALDYKTDKVLREALRTECADSTKLIVAQRIGTIRDADRIIVLEDGKIVGNGTHSELMENCEVYRQIAYSQLSKEELA